MQKILMGLATILVISKQIHIFQTFYVMLGKTSFCLFNYAHPYLNLGKVFIHTVSCTNGVCVYCLLITGTPE